MPLSFRPNRHGVRFLPIAIVAAALVVVLATSAWGQSAGSPFPPTSSTVPSAPATVAPPSLPNVAYDLARGPASPTNDGNGGWLPVISPAACPTGGAVGGPVVLPAPATVPPTLPPAVPPTPGKTPSRGGGAKRKATATTAAAAPATTASPAPAGGTPTTVMAAAAPSPASAAQPLKAGSVDDNEKWADYLAYRRKYLTSGLFAHDLDIGERHVLRVVDGTGRPVLGARIDISDAGSRPVVDLRTFADGRALFFPRLTSNPGSPIWNYRATLGAASVSGTFDSSRAGHEIVLSGAEAARPARVKLDVEFLIDTTGSMGDEIDQLRVNMMAVSQQIAALPSAPDVRFSMSVYRDCGDAFVSRTYDFDANVGRFVGELNTVRAEGGGDIPEALNQALYDAVSRPGWRGDDTVKLIFLVADAPPHLDYPGDLDYSIQSLRASRKGIKISPIASSGSDDLAEYVFRQMAQMTMGRMVFLTYGADGATAGDRTTLNVDSYEVLSLDQLVVRLASEEVASQGTQPKALAPLPSGGAVSEGPIAPARPALPSPAATVPPPTAPPCVIPVPGKGKAKAKGRVRLCPVAK